MRQSLTQRKINCNQQTPNCFHFQLNKLATPFIAFEYVVLVHTHFASVHHCFYISFDTSTVQVEFIIETKRACAYTFLLLLTLIRVIELFKEWSFHMNLEFNTYSFEMSFYWDHELCDPMKDRQYQQQSRQKHKDNWRLPFTSSSFHTYISLLLVPLLFLVVIIHMYGFSFFWGKRRTESMDLILNIFQVMKFYATYFYHLWEPANCPYGFKLSPKKLTHSFYASLLTSQFNISLLYDLIHIHTIIHMLN